MSPCSGILQPAGLVGAAEVHHQLGLLLLLEPEEGDEDMEVMVVLLHPVHRRDDLKEEIQFSGGEIQFLRNKIQFPR